jgi:DNA helicase HerA-like ATPase
MKTFFETAAMQNHPLRALRNFLEQEAANEQAKKYGDMRFVGYVLEIGYDTVTIITSDPFKVAVGGVPRNSLLIMAPADFGDFPPHFTLLRVLESAPTPLSKDVQQTYFELQKKSMPELDVFTQSELQWGALKTGVLGMFYPNSEKQDAIEFSGDLNNFVSAHKYRVYCPNDELLNLIVNSMVPTESRFNLGSLRLTECRLPLPNKPQPKVPVCVSPNDFMGSRTAMFGKTRLGKSNVVKLLVQSLIESTTKTQNVGQLIFDINGEYANDNPQDGNKSIRSAFADRCHVYALTERTGTPSKPLRLNFYERPESGIAVIKSLLEKDNRNSDYIRSFTNVEIPSVEDILALPPEKRDRPIRKVQMYWAILKKAGFPAEPSKLIEKGLSGFNAKHFNPHFNKDLRLAAYDFAGESTVPEHPTTLDQMLSEIQIIAAFVRENPNHKDLKSSSSKESIFDASDSALLRFLTPSSNSSGPVVLRAYLSLHSPNAGNFIKEILELLSKGKTVILDLGNATDAIRRYFSDMLSWEVFGEQERKFVTNGLGNHFVQLYFEEAHNLFPPDNKDLTGVYARFAKEGAKFHIGMVYSTQSPSTINKELLAQTENFFIAHLSSQDETKALSRVQIAYAGIEDDILRSKTPGYMRMLTRSHRFVVSVQAKKFEAPSTAQTSSNDARRGTK